MMPTRAEAEKILEEAGQCNFGPWVNHSRITAKCAEKIAELCEDLDSEKAYILGLLHDIGRKFGVRHLGHVSDEELELIETALAKVNMDDYDKLIQLCDALAGSDGVLNIEDRMRDVEQRYGYYPQEKWNSNIRLKNYFEEKTGNNIYKTVNQS